jgi:predicted metal-dependent peptidase
MGVDRWARLYYNPKFIEKTPVDELSGCLVHESLHLIRNHPERMERMAGEDWQPSTAMISNIASDLEENPDILNDGLALPNFAVLPKHYELPEDLLAEEYYNLLINNKSPKLKVVHVDCGSCADGRQRKYEHGEPKEGGPIGIGEIERKLIQRKVADDVEAHASKNPGSVPGWLRRWSDGVRNPKVPWQQVLQAAVRHAYEQVRGNADYSYSRMSRRQHAVPEAVLPGMYRPQPRVALLVDTSGSMTAEMLSQGLGEVKGVLSALGSTTSVEVLCVDAEVQNRQKVFDARQVKLVGGGGTILERGIEELNSRRPRPQLLILYSDCWCSWGCEPKGMQTIVVRTDPNGSTPPFGRLIDISVKEHIT